MPKYKESEFPITYRSDKVREIMEAAKRLRSVAVFGLAGMGKSNLLRFVVAHPQLKSAYLGDAAARFGLILVDCNLVDPHSEEALLEQLDRELERAGLVLPPMPNPAHALSWRRSIQYRLEQVDPARVVVILFDPLDQAFRCFEPHFWAYLRGLRDLQGNVVFVIGSRHPPPPLGELQELFADGCWVTPLDGQDALDSLARDEKRIGVQLSETEKEWLVTLTGGHPALLKNVAEWVARTHVNLGADVEFVISKLLAQETIQQACSDLWSDLYPIERKTLQWLALKADQRLDANALTLLFQAGLVRAPHGEPKIFSPLWEAYIRMQIERVVRIQLSGSNTVRFETWHDTQMLGLSEGPLLLLRAMAQAPDRIYSHAQLSRILYSGEPDYSREALGAQVKRLRKSLNTILGPIVQDSSFNAIVPERKQGYRLNLTTRNGWQLEYQVVS